MSKFRRVAGLLSLLGGSMFTALLLVYFLTSHYGPSGGYKMTSVLLKPAALFSLKYREVDAMSGANTYYVLDTVQFSFPSSAQRQWQHYPVTSEAYEAFYNLVAEEMSITPKEDLVDRFSQASFSSVSIRVKPQQSLSTRWNQRIFQEIHFLEGSDYFRVELRVDDPKGSWAYFQRQGVYGEALRLFAPTAASLEKNG